MARVIVTAQVEDPVAWEAGFRTHGDLFRSQTASKMEFAINGNEVAVCVEPADLATFMEGLESPATAEAMAFDGVKRETVKIYVVDQVFEL